MFTRNLPIALIVMLAALLPSQAAWAADCSQNYDSQTRFAQTELRLRAHPATWAATYAVLATGQRVEMRGAPANGWARVHVPALNLSGHVALRYLSDQCIEGEERTRASLSADQIADILMARSRSRYSGSCPCPYNTDRAGRRCGGRSAYSRPVGAAPLCYRGDVSSAMISRFRAGG